jgi:hypothetical protein
MEVFNYCNQCKKSLDCNNFDKKKNGTYYTRCKKCREIHNKQEKEKYKKKVIPFERSFATYDGITKKGKSKVDCWHPTKNGDIKPRDVTISSGKKCWFQCDICNHSFDSVLNNVSGNIWCPYCCVPSKKLCNKKDCINCFNKSIASYDGKTKNGKLKVDCWHPTKNGDIKPRDVMKGAHRKYWFQCDVCNHDFDSLLNNVSGQNRWCPYCCVSSKKICNKKDCINCFNKSFASYDGKTKNGKLKVNCWHPTKNGDIKPRDVAKHARRKYWFQCDVCNHDFDNSLSVILGQNCWCPYCSVPSKKLCGEEYCNYCFNKSFASYKGKTSCGKIKVDCWHPTKNGELTPRNVTISSGKKCWFQCDICNHSFDSVLNNVSGNMWCPHCKNKTELKLYKWLLKHDNIKDVKREYKPKWCSTQFRHINKKNEFKDGKYQYRYDFLITFKNKKQLIIELDGRQHFEQVRNWKSPLEQQIRDKYKEHLARKKKIPLVRCIQEDVSRDRNNWGRKLKKYLLKFK